MARRLLKPETYKSIPERDQVPVPGAPEAEIDTVFMAYQDASNWADYYRKRRNFKAAAIAAATRDRFYTKIQSLLSQLVIP